MGRVFSMHGRDKNAYNILVGKSADKSLLGRARSRWEFNIKVCVRAVVFNLFCSRTPRYNLSSTLYPQSCWYIMQVIHIV
jgi:hypothetical protein